LDEEKHDAFIQLWLRRIGLAHGRKRRLHRGNPHVRGLLGPRSEGDLAARQRCEGKREKFEWLSRACL
jgi:hypothetical protein